MVGVEDHVALWRVGRTWRLLAAASVVLALAACDLEPCNSLDLSGPYAQQTHNGAVIAVSDKGLVEIVRACSTSDCERLSIKLETSPDQLMLTGSGRWLVYRYGSTAKRIDLDAYAKHGEYAPVKVGTRDDVHELVGTLRGGDWVVYRSWGETKTTRVTDSELWAVYVGDEAPDGSSEFRLGSELDLDLRVVAMGHRHVVARRSLGDGTEELYLIRIAPAYHVDNFGSSTRGDALLLASGDAFQRVVITEGPSPAERGDPHEFQHEVPTDVQVIATSGRGADARTLIYSVADLSQVANFAGEVVTKHAPLEDVPGLSPVSPDGTHLAYITPGGTLALRNLDDQRSCTLRSSTGATHLLAGFAADGTMFFEAAERRPAGPNKSAVFVEVVHAYDPLRQVFTELINDIGVWRLEAVPPQLHEGEPWAIVGSQGDHLARPGTRPVPLPYDNEGETSFLPRGDDGLWVIAADRDRYEYGDSGDNSISVHEYRPDAEQELFSQDYQAQASVCVAASQSAARTTPWATRCSAPTDPEQFLDNGLPAGEQGP